MRVKIAVFEIPKKPAVEVILRWAFGASLLAGLADKDFVAIGAGVFVPLSLILGLFLNTLVWLGVVDARLAGPARRRD